MKVENEKTERIIIHREKNYIPLKNRKLILPFDFFNQYGNTVSMFENLRKVDEETVTKEKNIVLTRDPTASLLLGNVQYQMKSTPR